MDEKVKWKFRYLLGSEPWNKLGHVVPVNGLRYPPQRAQHHVQNQHIVVIGEVVVVQREAAHLYRRTQTKSQQGNTTYFTLPDYLRQGRNLAAQLRRLPNTNKIKLL